jgi:hypothetical protein
MQSLQTSSHLVAEAVEIGPRAAEQLASDSKKSSLPILANDVCPHCGHQGWHMAWCSEGPGPAGRGEAGVGFGRPEFDFKAILKERELVQEKFILSAAMLARAAPDRWADFVAALEAFAIEANTNLVSSELSMLQVNQGRAQAWSVILRSCRDAIQRQEEIERRQQNG